MIEKGPLRKDITFIYSDSAERHMYAPLVEEAKKRGYETRLTDDKLAKCEIGFYCQHVNHPQFSRFSVIMLHDIIQQYGNWPDIWYREPWDKYDVGFLPSRQWVDNWDRSSQWVYARPRRGIFLAGWPKADVVTKLSDESESEKLAESIGLDRGRRTVLYAPAWENNGKQIDFVESLQGLGVNLLVKQWDADPDHFPGQVENVKRMRDLYRDDSSVTILPPETNIFTAIAVSDILVSEESSTMCEAAMMRVPAISVSDWLIPDTTPSRYPKCDYDFVTKTLKAGLRDCVALMLEDYAAYKTAIERFADANFSNVGKTASLMMDVVDDCVAGIPIRYSPLTPRAAQRLPLHREVLRRLWNLKREVSENQRVRYPVVGVAWEAGKAVKNRIALLKGWR